MWKMQPSNLEYIVKYLIVITSICVSITESVHSARPASHSNEITYQSNDTLSLRCLESLTAGIQLYGNWYINGIAVSNQTLDVLGWSVQNTPSSIHGNNITLRSTSLYSRTSIVYCTIEGKYRDNIVNMYKLNKDIPRDTFPEIPMQPQRCPLFVGLNLTLTCAAPIMSADMYEWYWENGSGAVVKRGLDLPVSDPGNYTCFYKHHKHHQKVLLNFVVEPPASPNRQPPPHWLFCGYTAPAESRAGETKSQASSGSSSPKLIAAKVITVPLVIAAVCVCCLSGGGEPAL